MCLLSRRADNLPFHRLQPAFQTPPNVFLRQVWPRGQDTTETLPAADQPLEEDKTKMASEEQFLKRCALKIQNRLEFEYHFSWRGASAFLTAFLRRIGQAAHTRRE
jgi:hypothetical protein